MADAPSPSMQRALALARDLAGRTGPNPAVGAVLVRDGEVIAEGAYRGPGTPHAELAALAAAGDAAGGADAYVTLEPCSHTTTRDGAPRNSCAEALIAAGIARVLYALDDPDERVSGRGRDRLRAAGIAVEVGDGAAESARILEAYLKQRRTGLPFVTVKYSASLDGRIAAASGDSRWVSGRDTLRWAHAGRTRIDAIMVGAATVIIDNPQLTARPDGVVAERQPLRIVADGRGRIAAAAAVLQGPAQTLIATTTASTPAWQATIAATGAEVLVLADDGNGRVSLPDLLAELGRREVLSLLVEGGGVLHGSFFDLGLVDKVTAVIAPLILGAGAQAVAGRGAERMADAVRLRDVEVEHLGADILITAYPVWPSSASA